MPSPFISVICFWSFFYTWFGFLYSQASSGNCETMESWTICNFDPKVPLVKFIFKNKGWSTGLRIKINNKMEILLPIEGGKWGGGEGNKGTAVKQVSIVHLFVLHSNTWITSSLISEINEWHNWGTFGLQNNGVRTPQKYCKELIQTWRNYRKLGRRKWNYETRPWDYVEKETVLTSRSFLLRTAPHALSERLEQANISTSLLKKSALDARVYSVLKGPEAII